MRGLTVLYDESCGICTAIAARLARRPGIDAAPIGSPEGALQLRDLSPEERYRSVHVVDALGRRYSAGAALPPLLRGLPGGPVAAAACEAFPGVTERAYRLVARHRKLVSQLLPAPPAPSRYSTESRSTTNTSGSCGSITPPAPRAP